MTGSTASIAARILGTHAATVLDVGARWGSADSWWRLRPLARLVGFEPDAVECQRLNALIRDPEAEQYLPFAVGSARGERLLHVTRHPACSSLFPPKVELLSRYPVLDAMEPVGQEKVPIRTLSELHQDGTLGQPSFIKLDTQGSELDILRGAGSLLERCCGIEAELMFSALYEGQPLFSEVAAFLEARGFHAWRMTEVCHHAERSRIPNDSTGRLFWASVVFLRDFRTLDRTRDNRLELLVTASLLEALGDDGTAIACLDALLETPGLIHAPPHRAALQGRRAELGEKFARRQDRIPKISRTRHIVRWAEHAVKSMLGRFPRRAA